MQFLGVSERNAMARTNLMNQIAYDKVVDALKRGKQARAAGWTLLNTCESHWSLSACRWLHGDCRFSSPYHCLHDGGSRRALLAASDIATANGCRRRRPWATAYITIRMRRARAAGRMPHVNFLFTS